MLKSIQPLWFVLRTGWKTFVRFCAFQETDIIGISTPVTKWNYQITEASEIPEIMLHFTLQDQAVQDQF
jgi:glyoxylate carboligase